MRLNLRTDTADARLNCGARARAATFLCAPQVGPKSESAYQLMEALFLRGSRVATPLVSMQQQPQEQQPQEEPSGPGQSQEQALAL